MRTASIEQLLCGVGVLALLASSAPSAGEVVTRRWRLPPGVAVRKSAGAKGVVRFDLRGLPKGARIYRADLLISRTADVTGRDDEAWVDVEIRPLFGPHAAGAKDQAAPLAIRPPWYDRLDATEAVRAWAGGKANGGFLVKSCPKWNPAATCLDVTYEGKGESVPPQVRLLRAFHRAGQTFVTFREIDDRSADASPTWADLKAKIEKMDAEKLVRYRVYRHAARITAANLHQAERLGEVRPMSGYNVLGRSVDQLIAAHRRRAIEDVDFAKRLARGNYFAKYHPDMPEIGELRIRRLAVEAGKPLPPRAGLYVHHPAKAGRAYYAVVSVVDGVANLRDLSAANALARPVEEVVGPGEPVLQGTADVTVFFDYPGERMQYVQWAAPPRAHLPNRYYNWGVFVPRDHRRARVRRVSLFFHDYRQRYLKPPWPHRRDTVLLSPHDAPYRSFGYGHHEALGTLRSFRQGKVRPFLGRRVDAMLDWALRTFDADAGRVSCGGSGYWGGTAALQYGLRRGGRIATVCVDNSPDANPRQTPHEFSYYGRGDRRKTRRADMDAVWGRPDWHVPAESGQSIWDEVDLVAYVLANGARRTLPYLSLGAGSLHLTWKQETDLMKAYLKTHNAFMAEFFWGGTAHRPLPVDVETGDYAFEPRSDRPVLACVPRKYGPDPKFFETHFATGKRGYSSGGRLNTQPRWDPETIVDAADRLEMTVYTARQVVYAGRVRCDVAVRNTSTFRPKPGAKLLWTVTDLKTRKPRQQGETTVGADGLVRIADLQFDAPARLVVRPATSAADEK